MSTTYIPVIPTDNDYKLAYPATITPLPCGEPQLGDSERWAREDHIHSPSPYLTHTSDEYDNNHCTMINWGHQGDQVTARYFGWGFSSGPGYNPREFEYGWNAFFNTAFSRQGHDYHDTRFQRFSGGALQLFYGSPQDDWAGGSPVFTANYCMTSLATVDGNNTRRTIIAGGVDPANYKHFTNINGLKQGYGNPDNWGEESTNFFARVGDDYANYYMQNGNYLATKQSNWEALRLYDGEGNNYDNRWAEITNGSVNIGNYNKYLYFNGQASFNNGVNFQSEAYFNSPVYFNYVPQTSNFNGIDKAGWYCLTSGASNAPVSSSSNWGCITLKSQNHYGSSYTQQIAIQENTGKLYTRYNNGSWQGWREIVTQAIS